MGPVAGLPKPNQMLSMTNLRSIAYAIASRTLTLSKRLLRGVEVELDDRRLHLVALGRDREMRQRLQTLDVERQHRAEARDVRLLRLERRCARAAVGDEARDDPVEVGPALLPVVGVAVEPHVLALLPFHEFVGARADRFVRVGMVGDVAGAEDVLGQHRRFIARQRHQHVRRGLGKMEHDGERIRSVDRFDRAEGADAARVYLLQHVEDAELHVGASERLPVVELHALLQPEGEGFAVRTHRPGLREPGDRLQVEVVFEQSLVDLGRDLPDRPRRTLVRGERRGFGLHDHDQRSAALRRTLRERRQRHREKNERNELAPQGGNQAPHLSSEGERCRGTGRAAIIVAAVRQGNETD